MANALRLNTLMSLLLQVTTVICGFVVPWLILKSFGSDVNGVVSSINQFLQIVALLEFGVGAVIQTALYKPLAYRDNDAVSAIYSSGTKFFRRIAAILLIYVVVLIAVYPLMVADRFDFLYTAILILAMSISYFAQYYFGILDRLLLTADQKGYIQYIAQILTLIMNTAACAFMIYMGASIQLVKLVTSLLFLIRPLVLHYYVRKKYSINRKVRYDVEPIDQKWNGVAQHLSSLVVDYSSTVILTVCSTLSNVSIYAVYNLIIFGLRQLVVSLTEGMRALMGELWAKGKLDDLREYFSKYEWTLHTVVTGAFSCALILAVPFVEIYTAGVTDADYRQPLFSALFVCCGALYCYRLPYNTLVLVAGHYKQTQLSYVISAIISVVVSVVAVVLFGLVGVTLGMLMSMLFQIIYLVIYQHKYILSWPFGKVAKQFAVDGLIIGLFAALALYANASLPFAIDSFAGWTLAAIVDTLIWVIVAVGVNLIFFRKILVSFCRK